MVIPHRKLEPTVHTARLDNFDTPAGSVSVLSWQGSVVYCTIGPDARLRTSAWSREHGMQPVPGEIGSVRAAVQAYFEAGDRDSFAEMKFLFISGTAFQRAVWTALQKIPYGTSTTYGDIAVGLNRPKAVRAVGRAVGANPLALFLPCHRVVGSQGDLTGFACGMPVKRALLRHENIFIDERDRVVPRSDHLPQGTLL